MVVVASVASVVVVASRDWRLCRDDSEMKVFHRHTSHSPFHGFRFHAEFDTEIENLISVGSKSCLSSLFFSVLHQTHKHRHKDKQVQLILSIGEVDLLAEWNKFVTKSGILNIPHPMEIEGYGQVESLRKMKFLIHSDGNESTLTFSHRFGCLGHLMSAMFMEKVDCSIC